MGDFYPVQQEDGTISAPVLFKNFQRTWNDRQIANNVKVKNSFVEAALGALDYTYFFDQAKKQYLENPEENVDVVIFGHTHVPSYKAVGEGKYYLNAGTWVDNNRDFDKVSCSFAVVSTGETNSTGLYRYAGLGAISDILPLLD